MYVCVCQAVTDRQIRQAAAGGARTLDDLRRELGVARECGQCAFYARDCLREALATPVKPGSTMQPAAA